MSTLLQFGRGADPREIVLGLQVPPHCREEHNAQRSQLHETKHLHIVDVYYITELKGAGRGVTLASPACVKTPQQASGHTPSDPDVSARVNHKSFSL